MKSANPLRSLAFLATLAPAVTFSADKVDFVKQVKPLLEGACTHCHGAKEDTIGRQLCQ